MTSIRQIEANRRNAGKSTGPKSEEGRQRSRCNAVRHGLTAETVITTLEDSKDYKAFEEALHECSIDQSQSLLSDATAVTGRPTEVLAPAQQLSAQHSKRRPQRDGRKSPNVKAKRSAVPFNGRKRSRVPAREDKADPDHYAASRTVVTPMFNSVRKLARTSAMEGPCFSTNRWIIG